MNEPYYLTDKIFIQNNKYFYDNQPIKNHNWHHLLKEYGWEKLNKFWIKKLNKLSGLKCNNSLFGVLECGSNGDCLFNCISYAINQVDITDSKTLRESLSESIDNDKFNTLIETYKISKLSGEFYEEWNPDTITIDKFKDILKAGGDNYWGDFLILQLLKEYLDINIIILYNNDIINEYYYYPLLYEYNDNLRTIVLLYENEMHFRLVGYFNENRMTTFFSKNNIPLELLKLINYLR